MALKATRLDEITWGESSNRGEVEQQGPWMVQHSKFKWKKRSLQRRLGRSSESGQEKNKKHRRVWCHINQEKKVFQGGHDYMGGPTMGLSKIKIVSALDSGDQTPLEGAGEWTVK